MRVRSNYGDDISNSKAIDLEAKGSVVHEKEHAKYRVL